MILAFASFISALLVAAPTLRAAWRVLAAQHKHKSARRRKAALSELVGQAREDEKLAISALESEAHDLIEFTGLVPSWAVWCGLCGLALNLIVRAAALGGH